MSSNDYVDNTRSWNYDDHPPPFNDRESNTLLTDHNVYGPGPGYMYGQRGPHSSQSIYNEFLSFDDLIAIQQPTSQIEDDDLWELLDDDFNVSTLQAESPLPTSSHYGSTSTAMGLKFADDQSPGPHPLNIGEHLEGKPQALCNNMSTNAATSATLPSTFPYFHSDHVPNLSNVDSQAPVLAPGEQFLYKDPRTAQPQQREVNIGPDGSQLPPTWETARTSVPPRQRSSQVPSQNCGEPKCTRRFRPTALNMRFCTRHQKKYERNHADPPKFGMLPRINSVVAFEKVYPILPALDLEHDDVRSKLEDDWVSNFIKAANKPYIGGSEYDEFYARQQKVYNGKGFDESTVNVRMRLLYRAALTFHEGGRAVYPTGGDNDGYGSADKTMIFSGRLRAIISILEMDKRVCMDVIEGRGVAALVANPQKYAKRKTQNKGSNERKQKKQKLGDRIQEKRKAKGKSFEGSEVDTEDDSDDGEEVVKEDGNETLPTELPIPGLIDPAPDADPNDVSAIMPTQPRATKRKRQTRSVAAKTSDARPLKRPKLLPKRNYGDGDPTASSQYNAQLEVATDDALYQVGGDSKPYC